MFEAYCGFAFIVALGFLFLFYWTICLELETVDELVDPVKHEFALETFFHKKALHIIIEQIDELDQI